QRLGGRRLLHLLLEDIELHRAPARAAVFRGPMRHRPASSVEDALPGDDVVLDVADALRGLLADAVREVLLEERAHFLAERVFLGREAKVHGWLLSLTRHSGAPRSGEPGIHNPSPIDVALASCHSPFRGYGSRAPLRGPGMTTSMNLKQPRRAH